MKKFIKKLIEGKKIRDKKTGIIRSVPDGWVEKKMREGWFERFFDIVNEHDPNDWTY